MGQTDGGLRRSCCLLDLTPLLFFDSVCPLPPSLFLTRWGPRERRQVLYHILSEDVWVQRIKKDGTRSRVPLLSEDNVERCCCLHDQHSNKKLVFGSGHDTWVKVVQRGGGLTGEQIADLHSHFGDEPG